MNTERGVCSRCRRRAVSAPANGAGHRVWRHESESCGLGGAFRPLTTRLPPALRVPAEYAEAVVKFADVNASGEIEQGWPL